MTEIVALADDMRAAAGTLLATRHAGERRRYPTLPAAFEDPERTAELLRAVVARCDSAAALDRRGELVGFVASFESVPDPSSPMARYVPERASLYPVYGHAVAGDTDPGPVYAALFGHLAAQALDRGVIDHVAHVPIESPTEAAWGALGFGRTSMVALRDLAPIDRALPADVDVHVATPDDADLVDRLVDEEAVFHAAGPMFTPYRRAATKDSVCADIAAKLASSDHAFLIARRSGRDIGVISVEPGLGSPLYIPDGAFYIAATAVVAAERGTGAGAALVDAAFTWAIERGHRAACLHFATANATSSAFWRGIGFTPVMAHLRRRLDEAILTGSTPSRVP